MIYMAKLVCNSGEYIIYCSTKTSYILCRDLHIDYFAKYHGKDDTKTSANLTIDTVEKDKLYTKYVIIRNPYARCVSSFYALSHKDNLSRACFTKLYNSFSEYVDVLARVNDGSAKYGERNINTLTLSMQEVCDCDYATASSLVVHIFDQVFRTGDITDGMTKCVYVYDTTQLNSFIEVFNKRYNLDMPVKKHHAFNYNEHIDNAHMMTIDEVYDKRPSISSFLMNNDINQKIKDIFIADFRLGERYGYLFSTNQYIQ